MLKNRIGYAVIIVLATFLMLFYHDYFFFMFFLVVIALPVFSVSVARYVVNNTELDIKLPARFYGENQDIAITITINNKTVFPMPSIVIKYHVDNGFYENEESHEMTLPLRNGEHKFVFNISSIYSGSINVNANEYLITDYLGIYKKKISVDISSNVAIIPERSNVVVNLIDSMFYEGDDEDSDLWNMSEDVTSIRDYREYQPGDRLQRIHWRLSAKQDEWYVKEYERELDRTYTLLLELRRDSIEMGDLNDIITAFYSTASYMLDQDMKFQVQWYDIKLESFMTERVLSEDDLLLSLQEIYKMKSYENELIAYNEYNKLSHKKHDLTIYFSSVMLPDYDPDTIVGKYKERVNIVCLRNI
ncbi:MAG: DUF58 domain-containing protein [Lachnospiraceae bacterium]|nr:DUF58 domain-containing protein [Lachnospiraceae bacterium]